ncbi:MAG: hypothetical protein HRU70_00075 [Phycisphaeraceae bacterium]|nr:MAG: hypothetical protein HRU70_00075 [Phycisphaeraceae bacterium]
MKRTSAYLAGVAGSVAGVLVGVCAGVQPEIGVLRSSSVGGRDFGGVRFPLEPVRGEISFRGLRAWEWREGELASGGEVERLLLEGDVQVRLGTQEFRAARASVWLERISDGPVGGAGGAGGVYQVYVYFDRVGNPGDGAGVSVSGDRLGVRAVVEVTGAVRLRADGLSRGRPGDEFVWESERALSSSLERARDGGRVEEVPGFVPPVARWPAERVDPFTSRPYRSMGDVDLSRVGGEVAGVVSRVPFAEENPPNFARGGVLSLSAKELVYQGPGGEGEVVGGAVGGGVVIASGGVVVQYSDPRSGRGLQMRAQRVVLFLAEDGGADGVGGVDRLAIESVAGVYLEGDVLATDGSYTLRGPKVYYDAASGRAVVLDAVFWTYDERRGLPLYLRAEVLRQESVREFRAERARFSTSSFFEPEFSLGASSVTISRREEVVSGAGAAGGPMVMRSGMAFPAGGGGGDPLFGGGGGGGGGGVTTRSRVEIDAEDVTLRVGGLSLLYFPSFSGDPSAVPLKDVRVESGRANGPALRTRWDLASLLSLGPSEGERTIDLLADVYIERGAAPGVDAAWSSEGSEGRLFAYSVIEDQGRDLLKPGTTRDRESDTRGMLIGEQRWALNERWSAFVEASLISDETFVDAFFERLGEERREFASRAALVRRGENSLFMADLKGSFNDFIANEYLLQSRGYSVAKLPEASYVRQADEILSETALGPVSWWQEYRLGQMAMQFDEVTGLERGLDTPERSQRLLGIDPDGTVAGRLRALGYRETPVVRADTRQEFTSQYTAGPVMLEPFVVARGTLYDDPFTAYSGGEGERMRAWGSAGVRAWTRVERIDDTVENRFFDLRRMRHVVEPSVTVWTAGTNVSRVELPEYDYAVEGISEGTAARAGVSQRWQTERGEPGARSEQVDVFVLNTDVVFTSDDADRRTPFPKWTEFRPELSAPGNYAVADGRWQVSSALALTGGSTFDFETQQQSRTSAGALLQHFPGFSTFGEVRYLNALDSTYADVGASYVLTSKYSVTGLASYDLSNGGFQGAGTEVRRSFASFVLGLNVSYNNVTDETSLGFVVRPTAIQRRLRARVLDNEPEPGPVTTTEGL